VVIEVVVVEVVEIVVVVVVKIVVVKVEVVEVLVVKVELVLVDNVDGLGGVEISKAVSEIIGRVSIGGRVISELDDSGGSVLISGTVIGCVTRVVTSSICFVSAIAVVGADVILVLTRENHYSLIRSCFRNVFTSCILLLHGIYNLSFIVSAFCKVLLSIKMR
jgi:hypothetical protein